jgi:hypothetical protein
MDPTERDHVSDLYLVDLPDPEHIPRSVNMVNIRPVDDASLSTIWEEGTGSSTGSTRTNATSTDVYEQEFPKFPLASVVPSSTSTTTKWKWPGRRP